MRHFAQLVYALSSVVAWFGSNADTVTDWNTAFLRAVQNESTPPPLAARNLAILHSAIYDAVNAIDASHKHLRVRFDRPAKASLEAAAASAAHRVSVSLYPTYKGTFDPLLTTVLASVAVGTLKDNGVEIGKTVADKILAWRSADGSSTTVPYIPRTRPSDWRRTPPFFRPPELPQWGEVTPFAMRKASQIRPIGPPPLTSSNYTRDFNAVKNVGSKNSKQRTQEKTQIASFWSDFSYTVTPPGHWNQIAQDVAKKSGNSLVENARLFALLNIALADAGIAAWDAKYAYNFWRPVTAVQQADTDENPDTIADPNWVPFLTTPPFPEYVSGHSAFSGAAATVLAAFFRTDQMNFSVTSDTLPGVIRTYDSFWATAEEIGMSRIYGGIHYLFSDLDGLAIGKAVGDHVCQNFLLAKPSPPSFGLLAITLLGLSVLFFWIFRSKRRRQ